MVLPHEGQHEVMHVVLQPNLCLGVLSEVFIIYAAPQHVCVCVCVFGVGDLTSVNSQRPCQP